MSVRLPVARITLLLLRKLALRHWISDSRQTAMLALILALGIGCYLSIRLANRAALGQFDRFTTALESSGSDWVVTAALGSLRMADLGALREALGPRPVRLLAVLEETAARAEAPPGIPEGKTGEAARLLGVDFVALSNFRERSEGMEPPGTDRQSAKSAVPKVWIAAEWAKGHGLRPGEPLALIIDDRVVGVEVGGILRSSGATIVPPNLILVDLPDLQMLSARRDQVDRVEVIVQKGFREREGAVAEVAALLAEASNGRWVVNSPEVEDTRASHLTAAFRLNLTVLSLIALVVAVYLIGQAVDAAVVRRRREIGILRSLGLPPGIIWRAWMVEVLFMGLIGTALGIVLAVFLARFTVGAVSDTVNALYTASPQTGIRLAVSDLMVASALGLGASLLAGWIPARDAARTPPAQVIGQGNVSLGLPLLRNHPAAWAIFAVGAMLTFLPPLVLEGGTRFPLAGYLAALCLLGGGTILTGGIFRPVARLLRALAPDRAALVFAASRIRATTSRHRLAAAGLFVAVAMAAAMSFLIGSFEKTMLGWIDGRFRADVFAVSAGVRGAGTANQIQPATWKSLAARPQVADIEVYRAVPLILEGIETQLGGADLEVIARRRGLEWKRAPRAPLEEILAESDGAADLLPAFVSESFASRFSLGLGDRVPVPVRGGQRMLQIEGVFADYGNERGVIVVDRRILVRWLGDEGATNLSIYLRPGTDPQTFLDSARADFPGLRMRDNADLRATALGVFYQTFAVTGALKWIGIFVALSGLALALLSIIRENRQCFRTLRNLGMTRHEIGTATAAESTAIALAGTLGGLILSVLLGLLLIHVINRQSFGWTLQFAVPWGDLAGLTASVLALAAMVGYLQGWRAFRELRLRDET